MLLDEWQGFHPYTTWSTTTFGNAEVLLREAGARGQALRLGVLRTYATRHGPGPFVTEDVALRAALPERHNQHGPWQGAFRVGHFDAVVTRYALDVCGGVDALALTHLDIAESRADPRLCRAYEVDGSRTESLRAAPIGNLEEQERLTRRLLRARPILQRPSGSWLETLSDEFGVPVMVTSYGPTVTDKRELPCPVAA